MKMNFWKRFGVFPLTIVIVTGSCSLFGQKLEARLTTGAYISPDNISTPANWDGSARAERHITSFPVSADINYYLTSGRLQWFLGSGLSFTRINYYQPMYSLEYGYHLRSIKFSQSYLSLPIRAGLEVPISGTGNSFGLQLDVAYNFALQQTTNRSTEAPKYAIFGSLEYTYSLNLNSQSYFSNLASAYWKMQLTPSLSLITSVGYEFRPVSGHYSYTTNQAQTETNVETGTSVTKRASYENDDEEIEHDIIQFKIGVTKRF